MRSLYAQSAVRCDWINMAVAPNPLASRANGHSRAPLRVLAVHAVRPKLPQTSGTCVKIRCGSRRWGLLPREPCVGTDNTPGSITLRASGLGGVGRPRGSRLLVGLQLAEGQLAVVSLAVAPQRDGDLLARRGVADDAGEFARAVDRLAVDRGDDVTGLDAGRLARAVVLSLGNQRTLGAG